MPCEVCNGTGKLLADVCPLCDGDVSESEQAEDGSITRTATLLPFRSGSTRDLDAKEDELREGLRLLEQHREIRSIETTTRKPMSKKLQKRNSQQAFAETNQTIIVFDWDDTLFPTSFISEELKVDWQLPLRKQAHIVSNDHKCGTLDEIEQRMAACEQRAIDVLTRAHQLAHVVVVTLASASWVEPLCKNFYPRVGKLLDDMCVRVIYAQEGLTKKQRQEIEQLDGWEETVRYYGLLKGRCISTDAEQFYSQYEGQSWKNMLSIGDASFERYGLLAATTAYIRGKDVSYATDVWDPSEEGCWTKTGKNGHKLTLRAKCCKMVDSPKMEELQLQLDVLTQWLERMVQLDGGFDLDFEAIDSQSNVETVEAVLRGKLPPSAMPKEESDEEDDEEDEEPERGQAPAGALRGMHKADI